MGVTVHSTCLGCPRTLDLLWGQLRFQSGPSPLCSCLQCPQLWELVHLCVCVCVWQLSMAFYIFHRHSLPSWSRRFNLQLVQLVGRFWVFILCHSAPGFQLWFYFHLCMCVSSWGCHGGLGFAPVRARCGGGAAAWVTGVLAAPGTQGCWWLEKKGI